MADTILFVPLSQTACDNVTTVLLVPPSRYCLCDAVLPVIEFQVKLYESLMRTWW